MAPRTNRPADDARHPDTTADQGPKPEDYGFRTIEEAEPAEGPGAIPAVPAEALNTDDNSTFASRASARGGNKAIQPSQAEGKSAGEA